MKHERMPIKPDPDGSTDGNGNPINVVTCPICGFGYTHMQAVAVHQGIRVDVITRTETIRRTHDDLRFDGDRGSNVAIAMWGECGHAFDLRIGFHKGQTVVWAEVSDETVSKHSEELWRD